MLMKDLSNAKEKSVKRKLKTRMQPTANLILDQPQNQKELIASLKAQLDFYLGDSNLMKDKFLQGQLLKGTQISLDVFLSFNRIKSLFNGV